MGKFNEDLLALIKGLIEYYDLGYVLNNLDSVITLPEPEQIDLISDEQHGMNKRLTKKVANNASNAYQDFSEEHDIRKITFEAIRQIYPNFCQDMSKKIPEEDFRDYLNLLRKCSADISSLIASFGKRKFNYKKLLLSKKDSVSDVIDNESNSRLTFYQDKFVLDELNYIDYSNFTPDIQLNIEEIKEDLIGRIDEYNNFQQIYSSNNVINLIVPKQNPNSKKEQERAL